MAPKSLSCKECGAHYPLEALYVCEQCFGPLEVSYDHSALDPAEAKRWLEMLVRTFPSRSEIPLGVITGLNGAPVI